MGEHRPRPGVEDRSGQVRFDAPGSMPDRIDAGVHAVQVGLLDPAVDRLPCDSEPEELASSDASELGRRQLTHANSRS